MISIPHPITPDIIEAIVTELKLSQETCGGVINKSNSAFSRYLSGERHIKDHELNKLLVFLKKQQALAR